MDKKLGRWIAAGFLLWAVMPQARADEVVHFTNGAEMTVRTHTVDKEMVKLDLGGNSFISFPMSMVDKIVSAGQDVFLNPAFHPANQAVAGTSASSGGGGMRSTGSIIADTQLRGGGPVGLVRGQNAGPGAGTMLGEAADVAPGDPNVGTGALSTGTNRRAARFNTPQPRIFDPARPVAPGGAEVIMPPVEQSGAPKGIHQISIRPQEMAPAPPAAPPQPPSGNQTPPPQDNPPSEGDPPAQDPPDNP